MPDEESQKPREPFLEMNTPGGKKSAGGTLFTLVALFVILATGFLVFEKYHTASQAADKAGALQNLIDQLGNSKNKTVEDRANGINSALQILSTASKSKYLFRGFIDELVAKMTSDTKLNNLSIDDLGKVTMDGESGSYRSVADLAVALGSAKKLKDVQITGLSESSENGKTVVTFSMTGQISDWKTTATSAAATKGGISE